MRNLKIALCAIILLLIASPAYAINAVASIKAVSGEVKIQRQQRNMPGRRGLVLNDKDVVITGRNARVTILFRDGSEIRLFQNSKFKIEKSEEIKGTRRGFLNNLRLKAGSFWGRFTKRRQTTSIITPTATCGIKGTSVAFAVNNGKLDVSLSTGAVELENMDEIVLLKPGKMVRGIPKRGSFKNKITDLPYRISIIPDNRKIKIPSAGHEEKLSFTVQIINVKTQQNIERTGNIFISIKTDKIEFPSVIQLNNRGYARFSAKIKPFEKADYGNGRIEIMAVAEGVELMDIGTGQTVLAYDIPKRRQRTIRIDANSGEIR